MGKNKDETNVEKNTEYGKARSDTEEVKVETKNVEINIHTGRDKDGVRRAKVKIAEENMYSIS